LAEALAGVGVDSQLSPPEPPLPLLDPPLEPLPEPLAPLLLEPELLPPPLELLLPPVEPLELPTPLLELAPLELPPPSGLLGPLGVPGPVEVAQAANAAKREASVIKDFRTGPPG
jgi:hypothetical protein